MRILGIDPGLQVCGYACIETEELDSRLRGNDKQLVEAGVIRTKGVKALEPRLNQIAKDIDSILDKFKPDVVGVEQLYSHYAHPRTAILMGHARGVILQRCAAAGIEVKSYGATRIKKCITGSGHATKEQVQKTIQMILALKELPKPADVADAVAAAMCCAEMIRKTGFPLSRE
ncbi:MAG: crossover junction endodeoxyribonuclease RuvC [Sedimentisphaerales bacterium]|jgi:crossover junction endodeoxyribonuclease RuvC